MAPISRWLRILRICIVSALLLVAFAGYAVIQRYVLRWRAEHLVADIRSLQMGKSTWADAQKLMTRWGAWGNYEGSCNSTHCTYQIVIVAFNKHFWMDAPYLALGPRDSRRLGIRGDAAGARLEVIDGVIWAKDYFVEIDVSTSDDGEEGEYGLEASARTDWRTERFANFLNPDHPEYSVGRPGACEGCKAVWVRYTPFADPSVVNGLMDFNLACLSQRVPCLDQIDLMPRIWKQVLAETQEREAARQEDGDSVYACPLSPEMLGRDKFNVAIGEVSSVRKHSPYETASEVDFRLVERLKHATSWDANQIGTAVIHQGDTKQWAGMTGHFLPRRKFILAFSTNSPGEPPKWIELFPCSPIPLTNENLLAFRRGINRDIFPERRDVWP
jgi:hypothetical protein